MKNSIIINKRHLHLMLIITVLVILSIFFVSLSSKDVISANVVKPAKYLSLEDAPKEQTYNIEINEGGYNYFQEHSTKVFSYNNQIPGPLIKGKPGETITVNVKNSLEEPTTIHWHGLILANVQDGVPQVTQEPILPGEKYEYLIELRNPGLYWYHSHVEAHKQVESGLSGVILVENPELEIDEGNLLVIDDVLIDDNYQLRDSNVGFMHGRFGNQFLVNGEVNPELKLKNNRLRIVNTANARSFNLYFGGKTFTIIGMDIGQSKVYKEQILTIHPGERYDIILDSPGEVTLSHLTSRGEYSLATITFKNMVTTPETNFNPPFDLEKQISKQPDLTAKLQGLRGGEYGLTWTINGKYYPENAEIFAVENDSTVKMRITNTQGQPHPMHLHGQKFIVLSRNGIKEKNLGWKDTVMVGSQEIVDIVFKAEEKGDWVFHCHILEHAEAGMLSIVRVA